MASVAAMNAVSSSSVEVGIQNQQELKKGIADLYDESSGIWEDIWGDHMHHGYYEPKSSVELSDHRAAQIRMIEQALSFAAISGRKWNSLTLLVLLLPVFLFIFLITESLSEINYWCEQ